MSTIDPAAPTVVAPITEAPSKEDPGEMKKIPYPGSLNIASERGVHGHFSGCAVKIFTGGPAEMEEQANAWAAANKHALVVETKLSIGALAIFYTRALADEEIAEYNEISREAARIISERRLAEQTAALEARQKMAADAKEAEARMAARQKEANHLMEMGRVHLANCSKKKK